MGSIFIWASGNGRASGDTCSCDGYANSVYSIAIGSVDDRGQSPRFSEWCSSILACTYSTSRKTHKAVVQSLLFTSLIGIDQHCFRYQLIFMGCAQTTIVGHQPLHQLQQAFLLLSLKPSENHCLDFNLMFITVTFL